MQRRSFLGGLAGCLAAGFAPAAIGSNVLMPVKRIQVPGYIRAEDLVTTNCTASKITAGQIDARQLRILDRDGNVILSTEWHSDTTVYAPRDDMCIVMPTPRCTAVISGKSSEFGQTASVSFLKP